MAHRRLQQKVLQVAHSTRIYRDDDDLELWNRYIDARPRVLPSISRKSKSAVIQVSGSANVLYRSRWIRTGPDLTEQTKGIIHREDTRQWFAQDPGILAVTRQCDSRLDRSGPQSRVGQTLHTLYKSAVLLF